MLSQLKTAKKVVGIKQLRRALADKTADAVFLALDADPALIDPVRQQCCDEGVRVIEVETMRQLGQACGIAVGAATAAIIR